MVVSVLRRLEIMSDHYRRKAPEVLKSVYWYYHLVLTIITILNRCMIILCDNGTISEKSKLCRL